TVPGPPPHAPRADVSYAQDRLARKRQQADRLQQGQQAMVNPAKPASALQKRFWQNVTVEDAADGLRVLLDTRPVRTATKQILTLPQSKKALAMAIAMEWDQLVSAQQALKQHYIPLTSLTSRAVDIRTADERNEPALRESIVNLLMRYLGTDTLLCWAPERSEQDAGRKPLRQRQRELAEPIIAFLTTHIFPGVEIHPVLGEDSIIPRPQPEATRQMIRSWVASLPPFELAALERGVLATKSLLVAIRLLVEWSREFSHLPNNTNKEFGIEEASDAARAEVLYQIEQWGEVEDTHDVDREDIRRQLGSVVLMVS
ncbi:ATP12-domain-containing protein, partial [Piedraia hortae CBS 480.64]